MSAYGLLQVHDGESAKVDIVFLHGLRGDMRATWTKNGILWPEELLPKDIPESRVFLLGYDSGIAHRDQSRVTQTEIHSDADDLCAKLAAKRSSTNTGDRPIIFVAHSLGGLVAAQALVHGEQRTENSNATSIAKHLRGMIFLGTPFRGSLAAKWAEIARRILKVFAVNTQEHTLKLLGVDSERLDELGRAFSDVLGKRRASQEPDDRLEAFFFYETLKMSVARVGLVQIVEPESATLPGCGDSAPIRANHIDICKFETDKDEGYDIIVAAMRRIMTPQKATALTAATIMNNYAKAANFGHTITIREQSISM